MEAIINSKIAKQINKAHDDLIILFTVLTIVGYFSPAI